MENTIYGYDRLEINFKNRTKVHLKELIPFNEMRVHCRYIQVEYNSHHEYLARLVIVLPDETALDILSALEHKFGDFNFRKIEIFRDQLTETENEAIKMLSQTLNETGRTTKHLLYQAGPHNPNNDPDIFGDETQYLGSKNYFQRVSYCRYSKVTGDPCFHQEFRITGFDNIGQKTGIRSLKDLLRFHSQLQDNGKPLLVSWFNRENAKYTSISVDSIKLGLWAEGMKEPDLEPYIDENGKLIQTERQVMSVGLMGRAILNQAAKGTTGGTFTDLKDYLVQQRKQAKMIKFHQRSDYQKRICKLRGFNQFQPDI